MPQFGGYVMNIALPALLFNAVATRDVGEVFDLTYMAVFLVGALATIAVGVRGLWRYGAVARGAGRWRSWEPPARIRGSSAIR